MPKILYKFFFPYLFKGYSLLELLIVIVIITILITGALFNYFQYKDQANLIKTALNYGKGCIVGAWYYCNKHPNERIVLSNIQECQNATFKGESIKVETEESYNCDGDTLPEGFTIKVYSSSSNFYYVKCTYNGISIFCTPKEK